MGEDGEHRTDCWKMPCRHLRNELFRQEVDVVLARLSHGDQGALGIVREPCSVEGLGGNVLDGLVQECDEGDEKADACDRPPKSYQRLPRQPAVASGAAKPGSLGH